MWWLLLITYVWHSINAQSGGVPPIGSEYNDRAPDGSYRFGFQTGDEGSHYHAAVANKENQVAGRFGSRDPEKGRIVETQYTAGDRGFRARGPNIARKMDLSQNKIPYNPPVNPDSPYYNPSLSGYNDPNEDPSYSFGFRSPTYERKEIADSTGRVNGAYQYIDDAGEVHNVSYEAGAAIGFNVKTPFPDSNPFPGTFYQGPPSHPGSKTVRGKTSIVQRNDGSYSFVSAGPDQRRSETSDSNRNVKGSYTYIDDRGQQRTVEYIAGPNIGYRIISKGLGVKFPPSPPFVPPYGFPDFPSTLSPLVTPAPDLSGDGFLTGGEEGNYGGTGGGRVPTTRPPSFGGIGFGAPTRPPQSFGAPTRPPQSFGGTGGFAGGTSPRPPSSFGGGGGFGGGSISGFNKPSVFGSTTTSKPPVFENNDHLFGGFGSNRPISTTTTSTTTTPSSIFGGGFTASYNFNDLFGNDLSGGFTPSPSPPPSVSTQYIPSSTTPRPPQDYSPSTTPPTFTGYPDGRPPLPYIPPPSTPVNLPSHCCGQQPYGEASRPPPPDSAYPASAFPEDDPSLPPRPVRPSLEDDFLTRPFSELPPKYYGGDNYYKPTSPPSVIFNKQSTSDNDFLSSNKNFRGLPVRAHIQSVDLKQYGSKLPPPGIALERGVMFPG